jgi:hypothetical protein
MSGFDLASAQQAAAEGRTEEWVQRYLAGGPWANPGLSDGLRLQQRWWRGPVATSVQRLERCCGPEPQMEFRMNPEGWERRVEAIAASLVSLAALPPLIVEYRRGVLSVRDGSHRLAAIVRLGWPYAWVLIWYNSLVDYQAEGKAS